MDVVQVLTGSSIPRRYWSDLKIKLQAEGSEVYDKIVQLKMTAPDGKQRETALSKSIKGQVLTNPQYKAVGGLRRNRFFLSF